MPDPNHEPSAGERLTCPDCGATARPDTVRSRDDDGLTGIWHTAECPEFAVRRILAEESARRSAELRAQEIAAFSGAVQRLHAAVISFDADPAALPFISALLKLVEAQTRNTNRTVPMARWAEILNESFPEG
ncbi:hypothetical protein ACIPJS_01910 [Streptomyces sp. NPDC086783]|uniref:hypothetical protein n=1 Tax=Streptomyces sp. NPDC086783 TaxID=3365758 RepID=UPI003826B19D